MTMYLGAGACFVFFAALGLLSAKYFNLQGTEFYLLFGLLSALGLTGSALFFYFQRKAEQRKQSGGEAAPAAGAPAGGSANSDIEQLVREADARLAASQTAQASGIGNLPLIFVVGDQGTTKTSTVLNSGLDPELLSGQVHRDNAVVPTASANVWYARNWAFVEAGGKLMADPGAWIRLVRKLQPGKLKSLVGKGAQAPRAVLLCFDSENFTRAGAGEQIAAQARYLQARLGEISQELGIRFPVYVLFTKADRLQFFADYVRNMTAEEAMQVFGATVPMRAGDRSGVYAEEETRRLSAVFDELARALCDQRLNLLPREHDPAKTPGAYEFPREFRKIRPALVQFLVDVCRPSQLRAGPFLRGFYFSGVRPVVVNEAAPAPMPQPAAQSYEAGGGATRMFNAATMSAAAQPVAQPVTGQRRVPQWMFLSQLFHGVILQDRAALGVSGASTKVSARKRALLAAAGALLLLLSIGMTLSYFKNRTLEQEAITAARNLTASEASAQTLPSLDALGRLDALRKSLATLSSYEQEGPPLSLRWGLYTGSNMYPHVRQAYYKFFRQLLFGQTQAGLLSYLKNAPNRPGPTDDYGYGYGSLKAYLLTTSEYKRASDRGLQSWLGGTLLNRWTAGRETETGKERMDLAKAQFDFYSRDLANGNPYTDASDSAAVDHARRYLAGFSDTERVYVNMLSEADRNARLINFNRDFPGSGEAVTNNRDVRGAFTKPGWSFMHNAIAAAEKYFGGEVWVLGNYSGGNVELSKLKKDLQDKYTGEYITNWRNYIRNSTVNRYVSLKDASRKLNIMSNNQSPLLALFWVASNNTAVDDPAVKTAFQSVQTVVPPSSVQQYVVPSNTPYVTALGGLQISIDQAANIPGGPDPNAAAATLSKAGEARLVHKQITAPLPIDATAHLEQSVTKLLEEPITYAEALLRGAGPKELNGKGAGFCQGFNLVTNKFPFTPHAAAEASLQEVSEIFRPKDGRMWMFYETALKQYMQCSGGTCVAAPGGGGIAVNERFLRFFSQAARFSRALYGDAGTEPNFRYALQPRKSDQVESFTFTVNGERAMLSGGAQKAFVWPGGATRDFKLTLKLTGGTPMDTRPWDGLWSVFHFFADADQVTPSGAGYTFTWNYRTGKGGSAPFVNGKPLAYEIFVDTQGAPPVFSKDFLAGLHCVAAIAR